ncbi:MAG: superoxide dismutase [Armatimonadota bacterium]
MAHTLPDLPYSYDALEPYLGEETLRIHHDRHHQGYVDGLNAAEDRIEEARRNGGFPGVHSICDALAFNYSGHLLHSVYWGCMSPDGGGRPTGALLEQIENDFESFEIFRHKFLAATNAVQGSGWGVLAWQRQGHKLVVLQAEQHQNITQWGVVPVMVLDVWEHAYYLDYQNERARFAEGFFDVADWDAIARRFEVA